MPDPEVSGYIESLTPERREAFVALRSLVGDEAPYAQETMKYRMPAYEMGNAVLCAFAYQRHHRSPCVEVEMLDRYREALGD